MFNRFSQPKPEIKSIDISVRGISQAVYDIDERCLDVYADGSSADTVAGGAGAVDFARRPSCPADKLAIFGGTTFQANSGFRIMAAGTHANPAAGTAGFGVKLTDSASTSVALLAPTLVAAGVVNPTPWWMEADVMFRDGFSSGAGLIYLRQIVAGVLYLYRGTFTVSTYYSKTQTVKVTGQCTAGTLTLDFLRCHLYR